MTQKRDKRKGKRKRKGDNNTTFYSDIAYALKPTLLADSLGLTLDDWQIRFLTSKQPRIMLCCSRQVGKSTLTAIKALHHALNVPNTLVLIISRSLRQSGETFRKAAMCFRSMNVAMPTESESALKIEFANGSRIISLPGKPQTVRGYSGVSLLIIDEAAQVPDDLYYSVRPMLAVSQGQLILLSSPYGKRGFFFEEWEYGSGWEKIMITADECPRLTPEFLEEEFQKMGDYRFKQEYLCVFQESQTAAFRFESIYAMGVDDPNYEDWGDWIKG